MRHVVRISDGMGNQMFQYAFAYALKKETGSEVLIDPLFWGTSLRNYSLDHFNISLKDRFVSEKFDYILGAGPRNGRRFKDSYREHLIRRKYNLVTEKKIMNYDPDVMNQEKDSFFMGFWQTSKYFDKYREEIKKEFQPMWKLSSKAEMYSKQMANGKASVAMHVRRTDYVREDGNAALSLDYYPRALEQMSKLIGDYDLYIFSDDKDFVKSHFDSVKSTIVEELSDYDEFEIMRRCDHKIVANSTFSWWAAYLGDDNSKIIAPTVGIWSDDFYPEQWTVIDAMT